MFRKRTFGDKSIIVLLQADCPFCHSINSVKIFLLFVKLKLGPRVHGHAPLGFSLSLPATFNLCPQFRVRSFTCIKDKKKATKFTKRTGFEFRVTEGHRRLTLSLDLEVIVDLSAFRSPHTSIPQSRIISISL